MGGERTGMASMILDEGACWPGFVEDTVEYRILIRAISIYRVESTSWLVKCEIKDGSKSFSIP